MSGETAEKGVYDKNTTVFAPALPARTELTKKIVFMVKEEVLRTAKEYAAAVRKEMETNSIALYGSHARGNATQSSDIDIAVIVDHIPGDYLDTMSALWRLTNTINDEIEPVLLVASDNQSGFLETVRRTGIAV